MPTSELFTPLINQVNYIIDYVKNLITNPAA